MNWLFTVLHDAHFLEGTGQRFRRMWMSHHADAFHSFMHFAFSIMHGIVQILVVTVEVVSLSCLAVDNIGLVQQLQLHCFAHIFTPVKKGC